MMMRHHRNRTGTRTRSAGMIRPHKCRTRDPRTNKGILINRVFCNKEKPVLCAGIYSEGSAFLYIYVVFGMRMVCYVIGQLSNANLENNKYELIKRISTSNGIFTAKFKYTIRSVSVFKYILE